MHPADVQGGAPEDLAALTRERGAPLLEALERHLPGAAEHAEATGSYTFVAAAELGHDRGFCELEREAARLHEVGLVYVPRAALERSRAELDPAAAATLAGHFEAGYRLALGAGVPEQVCGWLLRAREHHDGGGAEGLAGDEIPIASRILRVACALAGLLAVADERAAISAATAADSLRAAAGPDLDPRVVEGLARALDRIAGPPEQP